MAKSKFDGAPGCKTERKLFSLFTYLFNFASTLSSKSDKSKLKRLVNYVVRSEKCHLRPAWTQRQIRFN